ncbi:ribonuclease D [Lysobacter pythonis]|uniref:Ribonuclease D n=1 Tax=Solilutibacter pythonis TaxID=2483112 RepID=A0A3M2HVD4_9GAMM|nr:ribonuclease D [Lysobacter pythonis]RMH92988.1 ribonuclease D [Lysobacter pythonis]
MNHWIDHPEKLCEFLATKPTRVGLDTEFVRERTWWPVLALIQIAIGEDILLVDARIPGMNEAIAGLLRDESILKIMHSPSEDLVAFGHDCDALPSPLFDTQAAAALCGLGAGLGYQKLVQMQLDIALEKGEQRSDWLRRPLSDSQLHYAAEDVRHLFALHDDLSSRLAVNGHAAWLTEDCARAVRNAAADAIDPWPHLGVRPAQDFSREAQARLLRLMRWREATARERDLPKNWVIDQPMALQLAERPPADFNALRDMLERTPKSPRKLAKELWAALTTPLADEATMPPVRRDNDIDKQTLRKLQNAVTEVAGEHTIPEGMLASRRWLEALLESWPTWPEALDGWRRGLLQSRIEAMLGKH